MTNEFIVWDKDKKEFNYLTASWLEFSNSNDTVLVDSGAVGYEYNPKLNIEAYNFIGITDKNNNKIYADCSIVKLKSKGNKEILGYCSFDTVTLSYYVITLNLKTNTKMSCFINEFESSTLEIIDTIQENKLGLIK